MDESSDPSTCPKCCTLAPKVVSQCHFKMGWIGLAEVNGKLHKVDLTPIPDKEIQYEHRRKMELQQEQGNAAKVITTVEEAP